MKKFLMLVLCGLILGACGVDPAECDCEDVATCFEETKEDFFQEHYSECVAWCTADLEWVRTCGKKEFEIQDCVEKAWWWGCASWICEEKTIEVNFKLRNEDCTEERDRLPDAFPVFDPICRS